MFCAVHITYVYEGWNKMFNRKSEEYKYAMCLHRPFAESLIYFIPTGKISQIIFLTNQYV